MIESNQKESMTYHFYSVLEIHQSESLPDSYGYVTNTITYDIGNRRLHSLEINWFAFRTLWRLAK